ncbi:MAG TPA: TIM44-like domain-containing protein [Steroidobacteraceae bacterium]|nr:TIM44-like domain-containing protein [Steroidobacteraceae bacterium]
MSARSYLLRGVGAVATLGFAVAAFARTGGGSHAAASGHSDGGSFGSGGSLGGLIGLLILVLIVGYILRRVRNSSSGQSFGGSPQAQAAIATLGSVIGASNLAKIALGDLGSASGAAAFRRPLPPGLDAIRALDPGFEMETFLQRAEMTFFLVKRGVQKNDAAAIRPYLNDGVFNSVSQGIAQSKAQHRHALLESLNVRGLAVEDAQCNAQGQSIVVHFDLVYRAKTVDDANQTVTDEGQDQRHAERWTFGRGPAARTAVNGGVIAARCPACGAELRLALDGTCAHCKASVTNGSVDWVVVDVQPANFVGYSADSSLGFAASSIPDGVAALTAADKDFSLGVFEGRVKTAFLALQDAWCKQNLDAGRAFMSPGAYFTWSAQLETMAAEGRRNVMENLNVRAIEPVRIVHGRVFDDLTVRISASAADFEVDQNNKIVFGDRNVKPFMEDWTFQRSVGVTTSNKPGTLENTCPSCGAPVSLSQIGECRYCKAAVTSGKFDWVVSRIDQEDEVSAGTGASLNMNNVGEAIALQVGGAIVGGLLSSLLSNRR